MNSKMTTGSMKLVYRILIGIGIAAILGLWATNSLILRRSQEPAENGNVEGVSAAGSPEKFALLSGQASERSVGST